MALEFGQPRAIFASGESMSDPHLKSNIALKEWAVVCDELLAGRQVILLRKGGILEQKKLPDRARRVLSLSQ
jgi:hypothetical protein